MVRPSKKGWINDYVSWLLQDQKHQKSVEVSRERTIRLDHDHKLYKTVQPTGLMYGHPVSAFGNNIPSFSKWSEPEKMKFILLDSLMSDALIIHSDELQNQQDLQDCIQSTMNSIEVFYASFESKKGSFAARSKSVTENIELMLNQRIGIKSVWRRDFWNSFFQNSLLFLDVYFFGQMLQGKMEEADLNLFQEQQESLRLDILKVIAIAAKSNHNIEDEEKALFSFFLKSAMLSKENEGIARAFLYTDIGPSDIDFDRYDSWIIKKYMLELAILTVWADRQLEETERLFVNELTGKLNIKRTELERSLLAIESFVIANWGQIHFLQAKHNLLIIKDRFYIRLKGILNKNKKAIVQEMHESKELMNLLYKMTKETLSEEEKTKVKIQLMDIIKTLPTFVIVALPGTFITLPLLLNVLPKKAFPTAFSDID
jgi:hypothetical protein